ncbi:MAG: dethiobiotin synthase [Nocardiaceae bacterium]|nr:dethiobiotin synthase [Nocardiaceae bacterium]
MTVLVVTGTSTGVGKTIATAALAARALAKGQSVVVIKPAQTGVLAGEVGDVDDVARLVSGVRTIELIRYPEPLAPDTAARRSGMRFLSLDEVVSVVRKCVEDLVIVEGAGGILVRIGEFTLLDVARELGAPVVVVAASGLGTLNHSELTVRAIEAAGVKVKGLIIGSWPSEPDLAERCNLEDLPRVTGTRIIGSIPAGAGQLSGIEFTNRAAEWVDAE